MPANSATGIYEFEEFRLDTVNHRLYSRAAGGPVELYPKAIELLVYLVRNNSRVISKEELLESLWRGAAVEEANLPQTVFVLRKALGESRSDPRFVLTYPKRGYRFIAAETSPENRASQRGMHKGGMSLIGRLELAVILNCLIIRWQRPSGISMFGFCLRS